MGCVLRSPTLFPTQHGRPLNSVEPRPSSSAPPAASRFHHAVVSDLFFFWSGCWMSLYVGANDIPPLRLRTYQSGQPLIQRRGLGSNAAAGTGWA